MKEQEPLAPSNGEKSFPEAQKTPVRVEIKDVLRRRDLPSTEAALLLSSLGFRSPYPPRQVNSLYFDSANYRSLERSLSGASMRKKARLRWYGALEEAKNLTLELKCKQGHLSWKVLQKTDLQIDPYAKRWSCAFFRGSKDATPFKINELLPVNYHRPTALVSYKRRYYESADGLVRLTLDKDLSFRNQALSTKPNFKFAREHGEKLIMEIKLAEQNLSCLQNLARDLPFVPRRFSKYCEALLDHLPYWQ